MIHRLYPMLSSVVKLDVSYCKLGNKAISKDLHDFLQNEPS